MTTTSSAPSPTYATFGHWLKHLRARQDLTQEALAEQVACSVQTIRFFESGKRRPSLEMAERLADVLQVPAEARSAFIRQARAATQGAAGTEIAGETPASTAAPPALSRLPVPATELIGRQAEFNALTYLITQQPCRLVTVAGPGGMGKTRLALHAAHELAGHFAGGAVFVSLAAITTAAELPSAIANALNVPLAGESNPTAQLDALLAGRALLLVLDNFEHLLTPGSSEGEAVVALVDHMVQHFPELRLLITSRERLRVAGEHVFELGGLTIPDPDRGDLTDCDAVLLFLQRARQVSPGFTLTPANRHTLARLCALLGGMPLGIELAAAWVRVLTPDEIVAEMARSIDFLTLADRSAPARHRSLRAVFEHSWKLLAPEERAVAAQLAVFRDGFDRDAARAVAGAGLAQLAALVDKSLVRTSTASGPETPDETPSHLRYSIHDLLRQFLFAQLEDEGQAQAALRRHADYFSTLATTVESHLYADMSPAWLHQLESEQGNLRAALAWTIEQRHDPALGLRLAGSLGRYWYVVGAWQEGRAWLQAALAQAPRDGAESARALALTQLGELHHTLGDYAAAQCCYDEALTLWRASGSRAREAWTLFQMAVLASTIGDLPRSETLFGESLAIYRALDEPWGVATVLMQLAGVVMLYNAYARAVPLLDEAAAILRRMQQQASMGVALNLLGWSYLAQGEYAKANVHFEEAMALGKRHANLAMVGWSLRCLGISHYRAGQHDEAGEYLRACLCIYQQIGYKSGALIAFEALGAVCAAQGHAAQAVHWLAVGDHLRTTTGQPRAAMEEDLFYQPALASTQAALSETAWQAAWQAGTRLTLDEAYALVLACGNGIQ